MSNLLVLRTSIQTAQTIKQLVRGKIKLRLRNACLAYIEGGMAYFLFLLLPTDQFHYLGKQPIVWKHEVEMLKIIIIIIGYTLNNFTTHITVSQ